MTMDVTTRPPGRGHTTLVSLILGLEPTLPPRTIDDFYRVPDPFPAGPPGMLIAAEPFTVSLLPGWPLPATAAWRLMYRSTSATGEPIAVTGTLLVPTSASGGRRPLVGYAVGGHGVGPQCTPSLQFGMGTQRELAVVTAHLARGWAVVVTDYQRTPAPTFLNARASGQAVLDAVRAARQVPGAGLGGGDAAGHGGARSRAGAAAGGVGGAGAAAGRIAGAGAAAGGMDGTTAGGMDGTTAGGMDGTTAGGMAGAVTGSVDSAATGGVGGATAESVPGSAADSVPEAAAGRVDSPVDGSVSGGVGGATADSVPGAVADSVSGGVGGVGGVGGTRAGGVGGAGGTRAGGVGGAGRSSAGAPAPTAGGRRPGSDASGSTGRPGGGPVVLHGYGQGGRAVAAAAELQPTYAPDVELLGVAAGAVAADLSDALRSLDGGSRFGLVPLVLAGLRAAHPELPIGDLSATGRAAVRAATSQCLPDMLERWACRSARELTAGGVTLGEFLGAEARWRARVDEQRIGLAAPGAPVLVYHGLHDPWPGAAAARRLAAEWRARGAEVTVTAQPVVEHGGALVASLPAVRDWLAARLGAAGGG